MRLSHEKVFKNHEEICRYYLVNNHTFFYSKINGSTLLVQKMKPKPSFYNRFFQS